MTTTLPSGRQRAAPVTWLWVVVGTVGWIGLVAIGLQLAAVNPVQVGFDLDLLIQAGRAVAEGRSPYDPELVSGSAPLATGLFYSYPPPVAQAMALVAWLPDRAILFAWCGAAVLALLVVADAMRRRIAPERRARDVLIPVLAVVPFVMPLAIGLLFGNLDVWFPALFGLMLLAVVAPSRRTAVAAGLALTVTLVKVHPASLLLWFGVRAWYEHRRGIEGVSRRVLFVAIGASVVVGVVSLLVGGIPLWNDYLQVVRAGTSASIVDPRNLGIAAQVVGFLGGSDAQARTVHIGVGIVMVVITAVAAWRVRDPGTSLAVAAAASLSTLPVTWYHYGSAMIPFALLALLRVSERDRARVGYMVVAAWIAAVLALSWSLLLWVAIGLVVLAVGRSGPADVRPLSAPGG